MENTEISDLITMDSIRTKAQGIKISVSDLLSKQNDLSVQEKDVVKYAFTKFYRETYSYHSIKISDLQNSLNKLIEAIPERYKQNINYTDFQNLLKSISKFNKTSQIRTNNTLQTTKRVK